MREYEAAMFLAQVITGHCAELHTCVFDSARGRKNKIWRRNIPDSIILYFLGSFHYQIALVPELVVAFAQSRKVCQIV